MFSDTTEKIQVELKFTLPGKERQDSVYSGLQVHANLYLFYRREGNLKSILGGPCQIVIFILFNKAKKTLCKLNLTKNTTSR